MIVFCTLFSALIAAIGIDYGRGLLTRLPCQGVGVEGGGVGVVFLAKLPSAPASSRISYFEKSKFLLTYGWKKKIESY